MGGNFTDLVSRYLGRRSYLRTRNRLCCTFTMLLRETQLARWWTTHKLWTALTVYHEEEEGNEYEDDDCDDDGALMQ